MSASTGTLLLQKSDVVDLLSLEECIAAVEAAFRQHGEGRTPSPGILGMPATDGGFHIKTALLGTSPAYFAAKLNGNFFHNHRFAMPNIQGLIVLCDAANGYPLTVMDSIEITILRTGAATAVAAKHLARPDSKVATICGCGNQGRIQLRALLHVLPLEHVHAFDIDESVAREFASEFTTKLGIAVQTVKEPDAAARKSDVCVTCTPAKKYFLDSDCIAPGTFVAAVGADNEEKQELAPELLAANKIVTDVLKQCAEIGDLHHAIAKGLMTPGDVHAELGEVVAGKKAGRTSEEEITIFDSTGTALQDVAAAALVYERAMESGRGVRFRFDAATRGQSSPH